LRERFYTVVNNFLKRAIPPTSKLIQDIIACEANYINSAHPDFISGNKAMSIVNERLNPKPPAPNPNDRSARQSVNSPLTNQMSNVSVSGYGNEQNQEGGFFTSFWSGSKKGNKKPGHLEPPPSILKASGSLSDREALETEVIKLLIQSYFSIVKRTVADLVPKAIMYNLVVFVKDGVQRELLTELYSKKDQLDEAMKESEFVAQRRQECKKMIQALQKADEILSTV
jgi:replication fork clamp-binding protein CrfC